MYKKASKLKLRFNSTKGNLLVEDLWDLSLEQLDTLAVKLDEQIAKQPRKSFIATKTTDDTILNLKFDIVKDIIDTKLAEKETRDNEKIKAARKQQLLEIIDRKKSAALENKSLEELESELASIQ